MKFNIKFLALVIVIILVLGSCVFNMTETEVRDVRLFIAGDFRDSYFLEVVDGNFFKATIFNKAGVNPDELQEYFAFDEPLLDDFFADPSMMERLLLVNRNYMLERGYVRFIRDKGTIEISQRQSNTVQRLIRNVARGEANTEFYGLESWSGNFLWVWAIIDGEMYWSLYIEDVHSIRVQSDDPEYRYFNRDLLLLTYELINLSPIDLGLETP